jgi:group I intron endonuclease
MSTGIYKITSPSEKIYIGQSIDIEKRWKGYKNFHCKGQCKLYNNLKKYGFENHIFEIIEECDLEQLNERETYWKQYYLDQFKGDWNMVLFCNLYDAGGGPKSEETKKKMSESSLGKSKSEAHKRNLSLAKKGKLTPEHREKLNMGIKLKPNFVFQYDLEGNFIQEYLNYKQASNFLQIHKSIISAVIDTNKTGKGFRFTSIKKEKLNPTTVWANIKKSVLQYDLNNNFIKEWDSAKEASKSLNIAIQHITACCRGEVKKTHNNKFMYKN